MPATPEQCRKYRQKLRRRAWAKFLFHECEKCGVTDELQFAHRKPTKLSGAGRGLTRRYLDVIRNSHCYYLLCRECNANDDPPF